MRTLSLFYSIVIPKAKLYSSWDDLTIGMQIIAVMGLRSFVHTFSLVKSPSLSVGGTDLAFVQDPRSALYAFFFLDLTQLCLVFLLFLFVFLLLVFLLLIALFEVFGGGYLLHVLSLGLFANLQERSDFFLQVQSLDVHLSLPHVIPPQFLVSLVYLYLQVLDSFLDVNMVIVHSKFLLLYVSHFFLESHDLKSHGVHNLFQLVLLLFLFVLLPFQVLNLNLARLLYVLDFFVAVYDLLVKCSDHLVLILNLGVRVGGHLPDKELSVANSADLPSLPGCTQVRLREQTSLCQALAAHGQSAKRAENKKKGITNTSCLCTREKEYRSSGSLLLICTLCLEWARSGRKLSPSRSIETASSQ